MEPTPGPWTVESRGGMAGREVRHGDLVIATVNTTCNEQGNREANARLIAQAPAMREALARLVATSDNPSAHALYMDEARTLLKEIEG